jgi:hypothetical protein
MYGAHAGYYIAYYLRTSPVAESTATIEKVSWAFAVPMNAAKASAVHIRIDLFFIWFKLMR